MLYGRYYAAKTYSTGPLPVKRHRNKGQRTQYYIADTHPAIISKHDFEKVQTLLGTKKAQYTKAQQKSRFPFAKSCVVVNVGVHYGEKTRREVPTGVV